MLVEQAAAAPAPVPALPSQPTPLLPRTWPAYFPQQSPACLTLTLPACLPGLCPALHSCPALPCPALQGFQRVADNLADTELDNPGASARFDSAVKAAVAGGWIEEDFTGSPTSLSE